MPVPPTVYGGTELVIDLLARGLTAAGHTVRLFTTGDSTCPVDRSWHHPHALGTIGSNRYENEHVRAAYEAFAGSVDIIHDHTLFGPLWAAANREPTPVVTTIHGPLVAKMVLFYEQVAAHAHIIAISHHQRSTMPSIPVAAVIHHGIAINQSGPGPGDGGYVLFLGRMSPDKGVHRSIGIARAAGRPLVIAAKMWEPAEHAYYHEIVEPLLGSDATYIGEVTGARKQELLAHAEAIVNPIRWPEPFGLVMIEALAAGTPVLAFPEGSAPEIVRHGQTGYLADDEASLAGFLRQVDRIDRGACYADAVARFSATRMVADHVALYRQILARGAAVSDHDHHHRQSVRIPTKEAIPCRVPMPPKAH